MRLQGPLSTPFLLTALLCPAFLLAGTTAQAAPERPAIAIDGQAYSTWQEYYESDYFAENGKRCGKPASVPDPTRAVDPSDCTFSLTNPTSDYDTVDLYEIPVVVHIIEHTNGDGQITDGQVQSQIDVLNEDFLALAGTPGAPGYDVGIQFVLADTDPMGNPTTGITRSVNNTWFNDGGSYWNTLAWDTAEYMNIYTNNGGGALGYVPNLPQAGLAGSNADRVVILWSAFGRTSAGGPPYDQGRTATHEVGHYLGLEHTFEGGCATASMPGCYSSGDLICDTNSEQTETGGCPGSKSSCGTPDPVENYMDYSNDTCMDMFTNEQSHRMRCSLLNYRPDLYNIVTPSVCGDNVREGIEDCDGTDDAACSTLCQIDCTCPAPVCGNDITEVGEDCDGTDDGACATLCTGGCACPAPVCGNSVTESGEECDTGDDAACPGDCLDTCLCAVCGPAPELDGDCRLADAIGIGRSSLQIKDTTPDTKDKLKWKWNKGTAVNTADFGSPETSTDAYRVCIYDAGGKLVEMNIPAGGSVPTCDGNVCWKPTGTKGFKYKNKTGIGSDGITQLKLKEGFAGKSQVQVKTSGKGGAYSALATAGLTEPVVIQLLIDDGGPLECFKTTFSTFTRKDGENYKAKGP